MITVLTPTGTLGYGFDSGALERGMQLAPLVIAVDAGSTDPGPAYLGSAEPLCSRRVVKREIAELLGAARRTGIPLVIGSAGGSGRGELVDWTVEIVREIAREQRLHFRLARIYADIPRERVEQALERDEIEDFEAGFDLTRGTLDRTTAIVAQMGWEPIAAALDAGADVVVAGRACDDLAIAAYPIAAGETDVYGCQQHVPLMTLPVPLEGNYSPSADTSRIQALRRAQARLAGGAGPADRKPVSEELIEDRAVAACPESGDLRERS